MVARPCSSRRRKSSQVRHAKSSATAKKRKTRDFAPRREFARIDRLDEKTVKSLDQIRADLQESIERTVRIQLAFQKQLQKEALKSNRVKHIIRSLDDVSVCSELQRQVVDSTISEILRLKDRAEERRVAAEQRRQAEAVEEAKQQIKRRRKNCTGCYLGGSDGSESD